jgi:hypothetical protein
VENCGNLNCSPGLPANAIFRACSACAGDYEDPTERLETEAKRAMRRRKVARSRKLERVPVNEAEDTG